MDNLTDNQTFVGGIFETEAEYIEHKELLKTMNGVKEIMDQFLPRDESIPYYIAKWISENFTRKGKDNATS